MTTPTVNPGRAARLQAIRDGQHEIIFHGQRYLGQTVEEAVDRARAGIAAEEDGSC